VHVTPPHHASESLADESEDAFANRLAAELDETIVREGPETVAAFIAEPVMGAGGVLVPPARYFPAVQAVLRDHGVLLIADEVICAFGRLGRWFGGERFGVEPDLITLAKGLTSGYVPMSACLVSERVYEPFREHADALSFAHGYTYSGHPVAAAAALANLGILEDEKLIENAARIGESLQQQLRSAFADHPLVAEVRGIGLVAGIELEAGFAGKRLYELCLEEGLIVRAVGSAIAVSPPLSIDRGDVDEIVRGIAAGLARLSAAL
jgi:adenosylmethionine-8-amino-7-oxononanoate aminotransferase